MVRYDDLIIHAAIILCSACLTSVAVIGFLNTNLTILEEEGVVNFTIGVLQGYLDTSMTVLFATEASSAKGSTYSMILYYMLPATLCPLSAGSDYIETSRVLSFTGDSVQTISVQIIDDGISEPPETFLGLLSRADGVIIPPNVHLEPNRATATIISILM